VDENRHARAALQPLMLPLLLMRYAIAVAVIMRDG